MKVPTVISFRVSKIVQKKQFVKDILKSITQSSGRALLVGGAVRDIFLDIPVKDLDFEVYGLTLEQLQTILEQFGKVSLQGKSFGVLRVHGLDVDWSLPRQDSSGRHPVVQYDPYMSYEQAFRRRDLTVNAMGIDMQTLELIDPFRGLQDLEHKILKAPDLHFFAQDPLRLLRVMQFSGRFAMQVDSQLSTLCSTMDMTGVSVERIEQEFAKLFLQAQQPSIGLQWLLTIQKFKDFLPGIVVQESLWDQVDTGALQEFSSKEEKLIAMWAIIASHAIRCSNITFQQLQHKDLKPVIDFMHHVSRHDSMIHKVALLVLYAQMISANVTDAQIKWLALWLSPDITLRLLATIIAVVWDKKMAEKLQHRAQLLGVLDAAEKPLLTGACFLDVAQGPEIGILVKKAYQLQIEQAVIDPDLLKKMVL